MRWSYLGLMDYDAALALQVRLRQGLLDGTVEETLLLLEHPPVVTLGRSARPENVLAPPELLARRGVAVRRVERGGDVTFHGPGQLVGYPLRRVERAVVAHVQGMTTALERYLATLGIPAWWREDHPGLWTDGGKVAAVGVDARGGVTMHGFALNLCVDLSFFELIVPCGYRAKVASVAELLGASPSPAEAAEEVAGLLGEIWGVETTWVSPRVLVLEAAP